MWYCVVCMCVCACVCVCVCDTEDTENEINYRIFHSINIYLKLLISILANTIF